VDANITLIDFIRTAVEQMEAAQHPAVGFTIKTPEGSVRFRLEITDLEVIKETLQ
jgi:hypothetical protein